MTEAEIEIILQGAKEKYPEAKPRIISDNGPQFIARDFKEFIRVPVQREMERGRSPLVSIPPLRGGDFQGIGVYRSDVFWGGREV